MTQLSQHSLLWWWRLYRFWSMLPEDTGNSTYMWRIGAQNTTMSLGTHLLSFSFCFCLTSLFAPGTPGGTGPERKPLLIIGESVLQVAVLVAKPTVSKRCKILKSQTRENEPLASSINCCSTSWLMPTRTPLILWQLSGCRSYEDW